MKKVYLILLTVVCLVISSCTINFALTEETDTVETTKSPTAETQETTDDAPSLPDMDFTGTDFFEDGYEVVGYSRTTDGDTASFVIGGLNVKCRFVGIDTPELDREGGDHEPYAEAARDYTQMALENADIIILERDEKAGEYDKYDRLLAHVWVDGSLISFGLISEGLATTRYYHDDYKYYDVISEAENAAREAGIGVWAE